jgi:C-terminal processing protease CtpA/Prc
MSRVWLVLLTLALAGRAQQNLAGLAEVLNFEAPHTGSTATGWSASPPGGVSALDGDVVHGGKWSLRIERAPGAPNDFSGILKAVPMEFAGQTVELRGFIRRENVNGFAALWLREDSDLGGNSAFASLQDQHLDGTKEWTEYSISLPLKTEGRQLFFGFLLGGTGKAWVDDMQLLVDGKPIWDAPKLERPKTVFDTDKEFDGGSKIAMAALSKTQIANLAMLGKVWGFLKYHHPLITAGKRHWDYDLFRVMPAVLAATDRTAAQAAVGKWIADLGEVAACKDCASLSETEIHLRPELAWIRDEEIVGPELTKMLVAIYRNRPADGKQFYVGMIRGIGNPAFQNEPVYPRVKLSDPGFQLLGAFRFWNIIAYWFPYRDVLNENWDQVLREFIPRIALAATAEDYQRELMALIAKAHDTHANLWSSVQVRPPVGKCQLPVMVRFLGDRAVVTGYLEAAAGAATGLRPGDSIERIDGVPLAELVAKWKPYYAASNDAAIFRDMGRALTRGDCTDTKLSVRRGAETVDVTAKRGSGFPATGAGIGTHDQPGDTFRKLSADVAYLKLSSVKVAEAANYIDSAAGTKGLVIDIRNYPSEFVVFALGSLLVDKETQFVRFTSGDLSNPGAFHFGPPLSISPGKTHYNGKVVILVDEVSQSQAEYTTMAFRSSPKAFVIGSTTAGADGNVSEIPLPGGLRSMISGIGVFYPDKRPTQRVGILPDQQVTPTIEGVRAGRDELLEAALRQILGSSVPAAEIQKLAMPQQ